MRSTIVGIKKTTLLRLSFILAFLSYTVSVILSLTIFKIDNLWFFSFCFFVGFVLITKAFLFHLDSSCFFGTVLFFVGFFYFYCMFFGIYFVYPVFLILAFSIASFITFDIFYQPFQLILALSLFFTSLATFIFILKIISLKIFLAILFAIVLLLICGIFVIK